MNFAYRITSVTLLFSLIAHQALSQQPSGSQRPPIIDMHLHAFSWDHQGNPPPSNPITGKVPSARTDKEAMDASLAELRRYNVIKAVAGGRLVQVSQWRANDPDRIIGGTMIEPSFNLADINVLRKEILAGRIGILAELAFQYHGIALNDPQLEPYWALAEELDIPVGVHTGLAPPGTPYRCCPKFRASLGNPMLLEEVLVRHPKLRIYLMHAGFPYFQETKAIMHVYPQVYADLAAIDWLRPREDFHEYLRALMRAGFGKRLMFGSDQMVWPEGIGLAIEGIESATFLTEEQKRDIFYNNAVRFLRLDEKKLIRSSNWKTWMQFIEKNSLNVRSAVYQLKKDGTGLEFLVFPMIHIGSREFYEEVSRMLSSCDLVLAEGVKSKKGSVLTLSYRIVRRIRRMDLITQHEGMKDSFRDKTVNADMEGGAFDDRWSSLPIMLRLQLFLFVPVFATYLFLFSTR
jgi:uncharacterized protein